MIELTSHLAGAADRTLAADVADGLAATAKAIPPKHLYDARGSALFEEICDQPEYYPTRAERAILAARAADIVACAGARELVELGSGAADKARLLLAPGGWERYLPVDVSESALRAAGEELAAEHPGLRIHAVVADFTRHLARLPSASAPRLVALLGGTIGNFEPGPRRALLRDIAGGLGPDDHLLLGTDLVKDVATLEAAYDDAAGVSAVFAANILTVLNRELGATFDPGDFVYVARWNPDEERIEMGLRARRTHTVHLAALDLSVTFAAGEELRTEVSSKFTAARLDADLAAAGLRRVETWTDPDGLFGVSLAALR